MVQYWFTIKPYTSILLLQILNPMNHLFASKSIGWFLYERNIDCQLFHDGDPYHIETSPLIWSVNQWTGFYMIRTSIMKEVMS